MFDIYTNANDYAFKWECLCCGEESNPDRDTRRKAFKDAVAHARSCLADHRTRQGTDLWPLHIEPADFMGDCMSITCSAPATVAHFAWDKINP